MKQTIRLALTPRLNYANADAALALIEAGVRRLRAVIRARLPAGKSLSRVKLNSLTKRPHRGS